MKYLSIGALGPVWYVKMSSGVVTETLVAEQDGFVRPQERDGHYHETTNSTKRNVLPSYAASFEVVTLWAALTTYFQFGLLILISYLRELLTRWGVIQRWAKVEESNKVSAFVGVDSSTLATLDLIASEFHPLWP